MLKNIGIIGYGFVGRAVHRAFEYNTESFIVDPKVNDYSVDQMAALDPPVIFVCLPAPTLDDGSVDASLIYHVFQQLADRSYSGLVVLKSTLPPSILDDLYVVYAKDGTLSKSGFLRFIYSPEFLREATWESDAIYPPMIIMAGNFHDCRHLQEIYERHSHIKETEFFIVDYTEAALVKYTINTFLAMKVAFFNQIHQLYTDINGRPLRQEAWNHFRKLLELDTRMGNSHTQVPGSDGKFGYGGSCFPKDVKALLGEDKNNRLSILREVELANTKIRLTGSTDVDNNS